MSATRFVSYLIPALALLSGCATPTTLVFGHSWEADVEYRNKTPTLVFSHESGRFYGSFGPLDEGEDRLKKYSFYIATKFPETIDNNFYEGEAGKPHLVIHNETASDQSGLKWDQVWTRYLPAKQSDGTWLVEVRGLCIIEDPLAPFGFGPQQASYVLKLWSLSKSAPAISRFELGLDYKPAVVGSAALVIRGKASLPDGIVEHFP